MKLTFASEQYGTTVEISFEATHLDQIREMFDQFLRGSGFHFEDEEEISATADKTEISGIADDEFDITAVHSPDGNEIKITLTPKNTADKTEISATADELREEIKRMQKLMNKPWVGLTDKEISLVLNKNVWDSEYSSWGQFAKDIEAALKERNNG